MAKQRDQPLSHEEQNGFVHWHLPGRMSSINFHLNRSPRTYGDLAAAALFARAICGFLGLRTNRDGLLVEDKKYFEHAKDQSREVKITDLVGGQFLKPGDLSSQDVSILEKGLRETNVAFAHLTFWTDPTTQSQEGRATQAATDDQAAIIEQYAHLAIRLCQDQLKKVTVR